MCKIEIGIIISHGYFKNQEKICGNPISHCLPKISTQCKYLPLVLTEAHPYLVCQENSPGAKASAKSQTANLY